jgi:hypothetical protein
MRIYRDIPLTQFEFWAGAKDTVKHLTEFELEEIESILEDLCWEGLSEEQLNDIFWHERDLIAEWLGYEDFDEIMRRDK